MEEHVVAHLVRDLDQASHAQHLQNTPPPPPPRARGRARRSANGSREHGRIHRGDAVLQEESPEAVCRADSLERTWRCHLAPTGAQRTRKRERRVITRNEAGATRKDRFATRHGPAGGPVGGRARIGNETPDRTFSLVMVFRYSQSDGGGGGRKEPRKAERTFPAERREQPRKRRATTHPRPTPETHKQTGKRARINRIFVRSTSYTSVYLDTVMRLDLGDDLDRLPAQTRRRGR